MCVVQKTPCGIRLREVSFFYLQGGDAEIKQNAYNQIDSRNQVKAFWHRVTTIKTIPLKIMPAFLRVLSIVSEILEANDPQ